MSDTPPPRSDYLPAPTERAILTGDSPATTPSPNAELAASVRALNAKLARLSPERAAEIQDAWNTSWEKLERQREQAPDDQTSLAAVAAWEKYWTRELDG